MLVMPKKANVMDIMDNIRNLELNLQVLNMKK